MAILNVTPDSFYSESRKTVKGAIEQQVEKFLAEGASIVDVGGYSSRPGADEVSVEEEVGRVCRGVRAVREVDDSVAISVDTFRSEVVQRVSDEFGEFIVNDISAGELDVRMLPTVAALGFPYLAMHMKGDPKTMQSKTDYHRDIVTEVCAYFEKRCPQILEVGVQPDNLILDPGFGFAKTLEQNYELLSGLHSLCEMGYPVLAGMSRKSMIYKALETTPQEALSGTIALHWEALRQGATILRVHDVRPAVDSVKLFRIFEEQRLKNCAK